MFQELIGDECNKQLILLLSYDTNVFYWKHVKFSVMERLGIIKVISTVH